MMMASSMSFSSRGHHFGVRAGWMGQKEERCFIYREPYGGSPRHGAAVVRRQARVDGYVQDGGAVWRRGGADGRPSKEDAYVLALEMDQWKDGGGRSSPIVWLGWGIRL
ncbi:U-box domain-containing protein 7 [Hordeum vulgare]|nr:U-box domain-containing protein 7 [Hordeum vulgare]